MSSTLAVIKAEHPRKVEESELQFLDRVRTDAFWKLRGKKKRTKEEEIEYKELEPKVAGMYILGSSQCPATFTDNDIKPGVDRLYDELVDTFGKNTPVKQLLIQRLCCAWSQVWSYERMFHSMKYKKQPDGSQTYNFDPDRIKFLAEARKGIESMNDQILRLTQSLQNHASPPIHVKVKNAIIAQNMQVNQSVSIKNHEKTLN